MDDSAHTRAACRLLLVLAIAVIVLPSGSSGAGTHDQQCRRVSLDFAPGFVNSVAWTVDEQGLIFLDVGDKAVWLSTFDGKPSRKLLAGDPGLRGASNPAYIVTGGSRHLLFDFPERFVELDATFKPRAEIAIELPVASPAGEVANLVGPQIASQDEVVSLATLFKDGAWRLAVVRVHEQPNAVQVAMALDGGPREMGYYTLGAPFLAALDRRLFFVRVGERFEILEVGTPPRILKAFPSGFQKVPAVPPSTGAAGVEKRYAAVERISMFQGLFADAGSLFVLTRDASPADKSIWRLTEIDADKDALKGTFILPTRAPHLIVVPGRTSWALIEKGPRTSFGQSISSVLFVPSAWFHDDGSPLRKEGMSPCGKGS